MIHITCDGCGQPIDHTANRTKFKKDRITVDLMVAVDGTWNGGHVCRPCIIEAIIDGSRVITSVARTKDIDHDIPKLPNPNELIVGQRMHADEVPAHTFTGDQDMGWWKPDPPIDPEPWTCKCGLSFPTHHTGAHNCPSMNGKFRMRSDDSND